MEMVESADSRNHYEVLGVTQKSSYEVIKKAYHRMSLRYHPDKQKTGDVNTVMFNTIHDAWEVLRNTETRSQYDSALIVENSRSEPQHISEEVDLGDMTEKMCDNETSGGTSFTWACRCGGNYEIFYSELEEDVDVVPCSSCSLLIRVLYEEEEE